MLDFIVWRERKLGMRRVRCLLFKCPQLPRNVYSENIPLTELPICDIHAHTGPHKIGKYHRYVLEQHWPYLDSTKY